MAHLESPPRSVPPERASDSCQPRQQASAGMISRNALLLELSHSAGPGEDVGRSFWLQATGRSGSIISDCMSTGPSGWLAIWFQPYFGKSGADHPHPHLKNRKIGKGRGAPYAQVNTIEAAGESMSYIVLCGGRCCDARRLCGRPRLPQACPPEVSSYTGRALPAETAIPPGIGGGRNASFPAGRSPAQWWELFRSEALDRWIARRSRTVRRWTPPRPPCDGRRRPCAPAPGELLPGVDGNVSASRQKPSGASLGQPDARSTPSPCTTPQWTSRTPSTCSERYDASWRHCRRR